jgi:peptidoglycan/LPS O-acetylase OafA/YrhL
MGRSFSLYLDLVRFVAACLVYVYHSNQRWLIADVLPASHYGHSAVVVFFVLSGYVIAYVTDTKERHWIDYTASRASRIYSVALPAVVGTLLLDAIGRHANPAIYGYPFDQFAVRGLASLALLNEWWFISITSFSNVPYWSICYEGWYYVAFGLALFVPRRWAWPSVAALGLLLGPKIVLLAPLWAAGVLLYRWQRLRTLGASWSWLLVVGSTAAIVAFHLGGVTPAWSRWFEALIGAKAYADFTFSKFFGADYLLGILVFLNFAGMRQVAPAFDPLFDRIARPLRFVAQYTFTLYLLHHPLFLFWGAVLPGDPSGSTYWWRTTALVALSVLAAGHVTENRRHGLKRWIAGRLALVARAGRRRGASAVGGR